MPISQKVVGGNSCGACAISYVLEQRARKSFTVEKIRSLWDSIKFKERASGPVLPDYTDPTLLTLELQKNGLAATPYIVHTSPLRGLIGLVFKSDIIDKKGEEGMNLLSCGRAPYAIGIYHAYGGYHYILTKFSEDSYWIMDSNAEHPNYTKITDFSTSTNASFHKSVDGQDVEYVYLGGCIVIS